MLVRTRPGTKLIKPKVYLFYRSIFCVLMKQRLEIYKYSPFDCIYPLIPTTPPIPIRFIYPHPNAISSLPSFIKT